MAVDIWECALGFMDSQVLLSAEEVGLFDALDGGARTPADVAAATGLPKASAERLLMALVALRLIERLPDGGYANGPEASEQLVRGKPGYIGAMFRHLREDLYPVWNYCKEALIEERAQWRRAFSDAPAPTEQMYTDEASLRAFMAGMHAISYRAALEFARSAPELGRIGSIVDVGGASGAFLLALAESWPRLRGTVFDLPAVRPVAEDYIRQHGLAGRLRFHAGDFWRDPLPVGCDAYSLGFVLHDWDIEGGSIILEKIAAASRPGGLLIIGECLLDDDRTGPLRVARMDLNMLVAARGQERSAPEYAAWVREFGFELQSIQPTSTGKSFLVARR